MYLTRCRGACGAHLVPRGEGMERRMYRPFSPGKSSGNRALPKRFIRAAASKKEEMKKEAEETRTPDSPPPKGRMDADHTQGMEEPTVSSSNSVDQPPEQRLSAEEIASRMAELRAAAKEQGNKDGGLFEGVLEEVQLISWPSPKSAVLNTLLVVAIVAGTSVVLLGVNTLLAEVSRQIY